MLLPVCTGFGTKWLPRLHTQAPPAAFPGCSIYETFFEPVAASMSQVHHDWYSRWSLQPNQWVMHRFYQIEIYWRCGLSDYRLQLGLEMSPWTPGCKCCASFMANRTAFPS